MMGHGETDAGAPGLSVRPEIADDEVFIRMTAHQRAQHVVLMMSFTALVITGLPLILPGLRAWDFLPAGPEIFWWRSTIHRTAGAILIAVSLWHVGYVMATGEGSRYFREMLPKLLDARQLVEAFMHKLGLMEWLYQRGIMKEFMDARPWWRFRDAPQYGKYNWIEKFEYLAVVWGNLVMILTGLALWFFEAAFALFPKPVLDVFKLVHGFEALLAFLAILIWHMYNVHFNPEVFPGNRMWLDGRITGAMLRHHHPAWYREIEAERRERRRLRAALEFFEGRQGADDDGAPETDHGPGSPRDAGGFGPKRRDPDT
jgi:cytochrome b subunit of formate dehydrogenase